MAKTEKKPAARGGAFPPPGPVDDPAPLGQGVQRTMTLLATSTPQHRNHVRVLFYGQSITEQEWSKQVADLRRRFPHDPTKENATTVVQGIANGKHGLEIIADIPASPPAIASVRTYRPPVKAD